MKRETTMPRMESDEGRVVPEKLAHVVLRAKRYSEMIAWYRKVFQTKTTFESPVITFISYDDEHHRIAFLNAGHLPEPGEKLTGVDHIAFTYGSLSDLLHTWERLKSESVEPFWCINHGPTTSMYYRDPDGNDIELQVDNFQTMEECRQWFHSPAFAANPIGVDYDPAELLRKLRNGVPMADLLRQGAAPVPPEQRYVYTTLPPPPAQ